MSLCSHGSTHQIRTKHPSLSQHKNKRTSGNQWIASSRLQKRTLIRRNDKVRTSIIRQPDSVWRFPFFLFFFFFFLWQYSLTNSYASADFTQWFPIEYCLLWSEGPRSRCHGDRRIPNTNSWHWTTSINERQASKVGPDSLPLCSR